MGRFVAPRPFLARLQRAAIRRTEASVLALPGTAAVAALALVAVSPAAAQVLVPVGTEFQVNTYTTRNQFLPSVAMSADGAFVVTWTSGDYGPSPHQDGSGFGVYLQRYSASGAAQGGEVRVNTFTTGPQYLSDIAMDATGDYVVTWAGMYQDEESSGIYAQRYSAAGEVRGGEFRVHEWGTGIQEDASVAMDADGNFIVVWHDFRVGNGSYDIYARRFGADGVALEGEFRVSGPDGVRQQYPDVAMDADGDFVVAWEEGDSYGPTALYIRRYVATGEPLGAALPVRDSVVSSGPLLPSIASAPNGDFVVAWHERYSGRGTYARRYSAEGNSLGAEMLVSPGTTGNAPHASVLMDADGDFIVAWASYGLTGGAQDVYARRYGVGGEPLGESFRMNTYTTGNQNSPVLASNADGDLVSVWVRDQSGDIGMDLHAQRYAFDGVSAEPGPAPGLALGVTPNPVGGAGHVRYTLPVAGAVRLAVYDVLGREVAVIADGTVATGSHEVALDAAGLAPGVYVVRLATGADVLTRRVTVAR